MKTIIYISRHSEPMKLNFCNSKDNLQFQNEKQILSLEGERRAKILSEIDELQDIDAVISSNYVRTMLTAKYMANKNNKDLIIMDDFGERKFGINSWDELPTDFENLQLKDKNYKMTDGESRKEVTQRMLKALNSVLKQYRGKKIAIVSHGTAMSWLFMNWCEVKPSNKGKWSRKLIFNNREFFDGKFFAPELFKLEFDDKNLINIENIKINYEV